MAFKWPTIVEGVTKWTATIVAEIKSALLEVEALISGRTTPAEAEAIAKAASEKVQVDAAIAVATSAVTKSGLAREFDGVLVNEAGMKVLLTAQPEAKENGLWEAASGAWTRPTSFKVGTILPLGATVSVTSGSKYAASIWVLKTKTAVTVETSAQEWGYDGQQLVFNPKEAPFNAAWNGVTDDTVAIQAAHNAAEAAHGTLWIPAGTGMTKGLAWGTYVDIEGPGELKLMPKTELKVGEQGDVIFSKEVKTLASSLMGGTGTGKTGAGLHFARFDGPTLNGNKEENTEAGKGGCGFRVYGFGYRIENWVAKNCKEWPLASEWGEEEPAATTDSMEAFIGFGKAHGSGKGVYFNGPHDSVIQAVWPYGNAPGAIGFDLGPKADGTELVSCHPWAEAGKPLAIGVRMRGEGCKIISGQVEGFGIEAWTAKVWEVGECCESGGKYYECVKKTGSGGEKPVNATYWKECPVGIGVQVLANKCFICPGDIYTPSAKPLGAGIVLGSTTENAKLEAGSVTVSECNIKATISNCTYAPVEFVSSNENEIDLLIYAGSAGPAYGFLGTRGYKEQIRIIREGKLWESSRSQGKVYEAGKVKAGETKGPLALVWPVPFLDNEYFVTLGIQNGTEIAAYFEYSATAGEGINIYFTNMSAVEEKEISVHAAAVRTL